VSLRPEKGISEEFRPEIERKKIMRAAKKRALKMKIRMMLEMGNTIDEIIMTLKDEYGYRNVVQAMVEMGLFSAGGESGAAK